MRIKSPIIVKIRYVILALIFLYTLPPETFAYTCIYDNLNRVVKIINENGNSIEYEYDQGGNISITRHITTIDSDGDGLPDTWEQQIIDANPGDAIQTFADVLVGDDFDNDGWDNLSEYQNDTDPTDPISPYTGDINNSGTISLEDAIIALKAASGMNIDPADVNLLSTIPKRKNLGVEEAIFVLQILAGTR